MRLTSENMAATAVNI